MPRRVDRTARPARYPGPDARRRACSPIPRVARRSSWATWWIEARPRRRCWLPRWAWSKPVRPSACPATTNQALKALRGRTCRSPMASPSRSRNSRRNRRSSANGSRAFIDGLVSHYVLDDGKLVVAHAGMQEEMQGAARARCATFALYGETTGETDEFGLPVRYQLGHRLPGRRHGRLRPHARAARPSGSTTRSASTPAASSAASSPPCASRNGSSSRCRRSSTYYEPAKPFLPARRGRRPHRRQQADDDVFDVEDVLGKRIVQTRLARHVTIREENATAALEVMSRFAVDPRWLIYLPPTMSPTATSEVGTCWNTRPRRSPPSAPKGSRRSSAKRSTWGPARS